MEFNSYFMLVFFCIFNSDVLKLSPPPPPAPHPGLGLGLLHKIRLNFLEASQQFSFYRAGLLAPRPTPTLEDQASVFISPRGRVAQSYSPALGTHFSRLLRHKWVTVGIFLFPGHHTKLRKDFEWRVRWEFSSLFCEVSLLLAALR
jgi:hypothetical protein